MPGLLPSHRFTPPNALLPLKPRTTEHLPVEGQTIVLEDSPTEKPRKTTFADTIAINSPVLTPLPLPPLE